MNKFKKLMLVFLALGIATPLAMPASKRGHDAISNQQGDDEQNSKRQKPDDQKEAEEKLPFCTPCQCEIEANDQKLMLPKVNNACGHLFHRECLIAALSTKSECPLCRTKANLLKIGLKRKEFFAIIKSLAKQRAKAEAAARNQARAIAIYQNRIEQFFRAVAQGDVKAVEEHLENYPDDVNARDEGRHSVLMLAAIRGHIDIIRILLSAEADIEAHDKNGLTALMVAAFIGNSNILELLLTTKPNLEAKNLLERTALAIAAGSGHARAVKLLLNARADINTSDSTEETPLMIAAKSGYLAAVEVLLDHDAEIEMTNQTGQTALDLAQANEHQNIADLLSEYIGNQDSDDEDQEAEQSEI